MSEHIHDQVSAFLDDELSSEECAFLVRRLERDPEARNKLERYSVIGSALRRELAQPDPMLLRRRVQEALSGAPAPARHAQAAAAAAPSSEPQPRWLNPAFGVGIAATVALAALFMVRAINGGGAGAEGPVAPLQADTVGAPSYIVPSEAQDIRVLAPPPIRLTNYLMHHGEYASRLSRTSVHSNVVSATAAPAVLDAAASAAPDAALGPERAAQ